MKTDIQLRPYQEHAIEKLRDGIRSGLKNQLLCAPTGSGKCLGKDTPVLMSDGRIKKVQDVVVGDRLMGPDGKARNVLSVCSGTEKLYRIIPKKGMSYAVNASHILSLKKTSGSDGIFLSDGTYISKDIDIVNINVEVLKNSNATARHCLKGWRSSAIESFEKIPNRDYEQLIPPYILGAWLGDGIRRDACICKPPCKMIREFAKYAKSIGTEIYNAEKRDRCPLWRMRKPLMFRLALHAHLGFSHRKRIPPEYKYGDIETRLQLLAGLIDSDGHMSNKGCDWLSVSEELANDFVFVCRSLGFSCYLSKQTKGIKSTGFSGEYWRASVSGDLSVIPTRDKKSEKRKQKKRHLVHGIEIRDEGYGEYFGFEIDGDRLFLLGDFTVTHNTVLASYLVDECSEKCKRATFVCDRISLINQTSAMFDRYGIAHGVIQSSHWRWRPYERVQVCSSQTLARRQWPESDLIIIDECHTVTETVKKRISERNTITIGLTATPFTKGLGKLYDNLVNVTSTQSLIDDGFLSNYRIFACKEPDMNGVKVVAGEWEEKETSKRALQVVGDCVSEYVKHCNGKKFICSAVDTAHVEELQRQFMAAGVMCANYTYKTSEAEREEIVNEFKKPDSCIRGLITVTAASKGFDQPDVECIIMARPLRNSLAEHIQLFGRGLRIHPDKKECIVLDHSGNCLRFMDDMMEFFQNGATELDDGKQKKRKKKKPEDIEDKYTKCPICKVLHAAAPFCPNCGHEYPPRRSKVIHQAGSLKELIASGARQELTIELWPQIVRYAQTHKSPDKAEKYALAVFKRMTGVWPTNRYENTSPSEIITPSVLGKIRSMNIAYAKAAKKRGVTA